MIGRAALLSVLLAIPPIPADKPAADPPEPPVRLKKKDKPRPAEPPARQTEPARPPEAKEPPGPPTVPEPEQDPQQILDRLNRNLRAAKERLAAKDPGEVTRQIQRDILTDLDAYMEQAKRQQQQQQQQASSQGSSSGSKSRRSQQARGDQSMKDPTGNGQSAGEKDPSRQTAGQGGGAKDKSERMSKIADLYKDVWGHLPETLRQEMDQYSREQFMPKYGDLLKQYYTTIAEKGRRKGD